MDPRWFNFSPFHHTTNSAPMNSMLSREGSGLVDEAQYCSLLNQNNSIRKFNSFEECGEPACQNGALREHYHCYSCDKVSLLLESLAIKTTSIIVYVCILACVTVCSYVKSFSYNGRIKCICQRSETRINLMEG